MERRHFLASVVVLLSSRLSAAEQHLFRSDERGRFQNGWLETRHSFTFSGWINPEHSRFGALTVINEDKIAPLSGFKTHRHENMEIVTIPISGAVEHKDTTGVAMMIETGEVQRMSAGRGVSHSEFNAGAEETLHLFQIWIHPKERNIRPSYEKKPLPDMHNRLAPIATGIEESEEALYIHQDARILRGRFDAGEKIEHVLFGSNGAYIHLVSGTVEINGERLRPGDAIGVTGNRRVRIDVLDESDLLLFDVPMKNFRR